MRPRLLALLLIVVLGAVFLLYGSHAGHQMAEAQSQTPTPEGCSGLIISKDADVEVGEGGEIIYTIHIENQGTVDCGDVVISDMIPNDTDCIATDIIEEGSDVDIAEADGCDSNGDVTWEVTQGSLDGIEPGDEAEVEMTVALTSGAEEGDGIDNEACVLSGGVEDCDTVTVDVGAAATPTGDVNCDGQVSMSDAMFIAQYVARLRAFLGCP